MKVAIRNFWVVVLLVAVFFNVFAVDVAAAEDDKSMDVVMIIDVSGSMDDTDPDGVAREAAKLFIDTMELSGSRVGIVSFSSQATVVPMTKVDSTTDKRNLKRVIDGFENKGATDIGLALTEAVGVLEKASDVGNEQMILFLTDGRIDISSNGRNNQMSLNDTNAAVEKAVDKYKIYTIGLNADGNVDKNLLEDIAGKTGARSYVVDNAEELPDIFNGILADFIESNILDLGTYTLDGKAAQEIKVAVPDTGVVEANFVMVASKRITDLSIINPDGKYVPIDESSVIWNQSKNYSILKMVKPVPGEWTLKMNGEPGCEVQIKNIFNYNLTITTECILDSSGAMLNVYGYIYDEDNNLITDGNVYSGFEAATFLMDKSGKIIKIPMIVDGNRFLSDNSEAIAEGEYTVWAELNSESVHRSSEPSIVEITFPKVSFNPGVMDTLELKGFKAEETTIDITDCIASESINSIAFYSDNIMVAVDKGNVLSARLNIVDGERKCKVTLKGKSDGDALLTVVFTDRYGQKATKEIAVKVDYVIYSFIPLILLVVAIGAGAAAGIFVYKKKSVQQTKWKGFFKCTIAEGSAKNEYMCSLDSYEGEITLSKVMSDNDIRGEFVAEAANVKLVFDAKDDLINVTNRSKLKVEHPIVGPSGKFVLGNKGRCILVDAGYSSTKKITIQYGITEDMA